ncbi:stealth family protein [Paractinoplanes rishiriensis]|uniref:Exopolysaccharide phosphotransferase n=1 Tax=Paractinoplanes rishiriensis TaxID=1050105 RepID=A0A919JUH5_9ACTN|nr:stealth family protein [Actinoplanes rishiriensis]GIE93647.1 exopolysaccharide phosphotransferase [Actinoplanes rishiriensis]
MPLRRIFQLTPWPVRRRVLASAQHRLLRYVPAERRLAVSRRVVPLGATARRPTAEAAIRKVRVGRRRLAARATAATNPSAVRRANLDRIVAALDIAGIEWFRVPVESLTGSALAVPERDRYRVLPLLETLSASDAGVLEAVGGGSGRRARQKAAVLRLSWPVTDPRGSLTFGTEYGCEIEFWRDENGTLSGPRSNPVSNLVAADEPAVVASESVFGSFAAASEPGTYRTREVFTMVSPDRVAFPIDVVYTWVDGGDPDWRARKAAALRENGWVSEVSGQAANDSRFVSRDELRYSLRALHAFAPWVRHIFLVTDGQVPAWLDTGRPDLTVVTHREIFGDTGRLPTFNSQAIESRLHRIPGLAEHFLYLNDDVILGRPVAPEMFFTPGGLTRFFPSTALVDSAPRQPTDPPANSAGKNNRRLIQQAFGRVLTRKMKHTPHPSRRSVLAEIELRFAEHVTATAGHQFRHPDDIAMLSSLQQYYAYLTGRAAPGDIKYMYTDLADPVTPLRLARALHDRHLDAFCLNDTDSSPAAAAEQAALLAEFLPLYLPFPSPYELTAPRPATTALTAALTAAPRPALVARQGSRSRPGSPANPARPGSAANPGRQGSRANPGGPVHPDIALPDSSLT